MTDYARPVTFEAKLTAYVMCDHEAREQFAAELRRIAEVIEEGSTSAESGNMGCADHGNWEIKGEEES